MLNNVPAHVERAKKQITAVAKAVDKELALRKNGSNVAKAYVDYVESTRDLGRGIVRTAVTYGGLYATVQGAVHDIKGRIYTKVGQTACDLSNNHLATDSPVATTDREIFGALKAELGNGKKDVLRSKL